VRHEYSDSRASGSGRVIAARVDAGWTSERRSIVIDVVDVNDDRHTGAELMRRVVVTSHADQLIHALQTHRTRASHISTDVQHIRWLKY